MEWEDMYLAGKKGDVEYFKRMRETGGGESNKIDMAGGKLGRTVLHVAAASGHEELVQYLCEELHAQVNKSDLTGRTALWHAVDAKQTAVAMLLVNVSADVNMADVAGNSALHVAVRAREADMIEGLLDAGADPGMRNKEGKTAVDMCGEDVELRLRMLGYRDMQREMHKAREEKQAVCLIGDELQGLSGEVSLAFSSRSRYACVCVVRWKSTEVMENRGFFLLGLQDEQAQACEVKLSQDGFRSFVSSRTFPPVSSCAVTSSGTCIVAQKDGHVYISHDGLTSMHPAQACKRGDR
eukprot:243636-Hanusia_phi.AAC.1